MKLRHLLSSIALLTIMPAVAFYAARSFDRAAQMIGPYLLVSPFLAFSIAALVFGREFWSRTQTETTSDELSQRVSPLLLKAGLPARPTYVYNDPQTRKRVTFGSDGAVWVNLASWNELSTAEQQFALARQVSEVAERSVSLSGRYALHAATILAGGAIAALNPWFILLMHSGFGIYIFAMGKRRMVDAIYRLDAAAFRLTGDLEGAYSYLRWEESERGEEHFATDESRMQALGNL